MNIVYFFRTQTSERSIEQVFYTIANKLGIKNFKYVPYRKITLIKILKNLWYTYKNSLKDGINHITGDISYCAIVLFGRKTILTIHDLVALEKTGGLKYYLLKYLWFYIPVRCATIVTCISETTKQRLMEVTSCNPKRIKVIYNPISPKFKYVPRTFNSELPTILVVGTRENKNLLRVIEAVKGLSVILRIVGVLNEEQQKALKTNDVNFQNVYHLSEEEIVNEYINSDIVCFPSLYEGFGMPIIEGQKTGRIVITSNLDPMKEVSNGSTILVNPYDVNSIRDGILNAINNETLRNELIDLGIENVKRFHPDTISKEYLNTYININKKLS